MRIKSSGAIAAITALTAVALASYSILPTGYCKLRHRVTRRKEDNVLYLTFDDGPDAQFTPELLDLLEEFGVKASFFVVANFASEHRDILERMKEQGHVIGLHSLEHKNALWQTPGYTEKDFEKSLCMMKELGITVGYYRPPWGHFNAVTMDIIKRCGLEPVLWDVMAQDWKGNTTSDKIVRRLLRRTENGDIICLHDGRGTKDAPARTIEALRTVLPLWLEKGYQFKTVDHYGK